MKRGGSVFKAVRGEYGSGKTFLARWMQERAKKSGFAVAEVQISETETPLHKLETVYRRMIEHLATSDVDRGALKSVFDAWFYTLEEDVLSTGSVNPNDAEGLLKTTNELLEQRLASISKSAPMFSATLRAYRETSAQGDSATAEGLLAWISGQPNVAAGIKRVANVKGVIDHFGALSFLQGLLVVLRDAGFSGLVLVLDEVETLQRVRGDVRVEELARHLNEQGVRTFVSHSSLSLDQRTQAETAFSEATDCVIVATSTLELGIDVGDLDRVIQVDAPPFIASFLQRMGRTGRRPGTRRNCLFLATSEESLLQAAAMVRLWKRGYVEPIEPPVRPIHLFAQQVLASVLQNDGLPLSDAASVDARLSAFREIPMEERQRTIQFMVARGWLWDDSGILRIGEAADAEYGRRHFMELLSIFDSPPLFSVKYGNTDLGFVHETTFFVKRDGPAVLLLGGRGWQVTHLDWDRRVAYVAPSDVHGKSRWLGSGQPLRFELCQSIRSVLAASDDEPEWSPRAVEALREMRQDFAWLDEQSTQLMIDVKAGVTRWWTFAGDLANAMLAERLGFALSLTVKHDNLAVRIAGVVTSHEFHEALEEIRRDPPKIGSADVTEEALKSVKFADCVPDELVVSMLRERLEDRESVAATLRAQLVVVSDYDPGLMRVRVGGLRCSHRG